MLLALALSCAQAGTGHPLGAAEGQARSSAEPQVLTLCQADPQRYAYRMALTRLLLARTAAPGERTELRPYAPGPDPTQERCLGLLRQGLVDLVYLPPQAELLREFSAIPFDLHQGMLGYRLLLIHKKDQARFAAVHDLAGLRQLTGGFGRQWADFALFERNQLPVVGVAQGQSLLAMLQSGRFQYFHRGLHEAWAELEANPQLDQLMVEPHLALHYRFPVYYLFRKDRAALRQRMERGLALIQADGSFAALFRQHFQAIARRAQLGNRTILEIDAPLPPGLPPEDSRLWLAP